MGAGQFSIFGANEEKEWQGFSEIDKDQERASEDVARCMIVSVSSSEPRLRKNLVQWAAGLSTEHAQEMQKGSFEFLASSFGLGPRIRSLRVAAG